MGILIEIKTPHNRDCKCSFEIDFINFLCYYAILQKVEDTKQNSHKNGKIMGFHPNSLKIQLSQLLTVYGMNAIVWSEGLQK